jgi:hypothetical protein
MKRIVLLTFTLILVKLLSAQGNLVPNPGFEINTSCPTTNGDFPKVVGWKNPTGASPDYFSTCAPPGLSVPNNFPGTQNAHTGNAYPGLVGFGVTYYEYIQVRLSDSLDQGETYCVNYYVSLAEMSLFASIAPQAFFSPDSITSSTTGAFNFSPQVIDWNIIYDTVNWVLISGEFIAQGGEEYLTIGHFISPAATPYDTLNPSPPTSPCSYFYIEDVAVYKKVSANAGNDRTICKGESTTLGVSSVGEVTYSWTGSWLSDSTIANPLVNPEMTTTYYLVIADTGLLYCPGSIIDSVTVTVNDCSDFFVPTILKNDELFVIQKLPPNSNLQVFDARGRLIYQNADYDNSWSLINCSVGIYVYQITFPDSTIQNGKFSIVK